MAQLQTAQLQEMTARSGLFGRRRAQAAGSRPPRERGDSTRSFLLTLIAVLALAAFLSPMLRSVAYAVKSTDQITQAGTPPWPADPLTYSYQGKDLPLLLVPLPDGTTRQLALFEPGRKSSTFVDPASPDAPPITWQGSWRTLDHIWQFAPHWENFAKVWDLIDYPRLMFNTLAIAVISTIGTLLSCTLVAYGFARFKFPGRSFLFTLLIATIFLPTAVTIIPTYMIFQKLGWVGTWLPLLVPTFFANAYDVFLMRQYFMTIPTEMDEAAAIDGAGPFRTLISVILPQAWPVVIAVAIFHLVYAWNDFFGPLIYLSSNPEIQTIALGLQRFNGVHYREPGLIQAGTLMTLIIPVIAFLLTQRFFTRGIVITGVDK
jgi:ABC-type sugar transport system, permease component